jgi:hypothetical protein
VLTALLEEVVGSIEVESTRSSSSSSELAYELSDAEVATNPGEALGGLDLA